MAQNEPQRKETPPRPSPNSPSLLFEYQCRSGKFIRLANRIESKLFGPNWNALVSTATPIEHRIGRSDATLVDSRLLLLLLLLVTKAVFCGA